jgi:nitroreductase
MVQADANRPHQAAALGLETVRGIGGAPSVTRAKPAAFKRDNKWMAFLSTAPDASELSRLLQQRYSCRGFLAESVPKATLERIATLAQRTASWCNAQPWRVHITSGDATQRFRDLMLAPVQDGEPAADFPWPREFFRLFGAPHVAMITTDEALGVYGAVDCGAYVANFMLAATAMGVATIAQAALASRPQRVRDFFALAPGRRVVCGISLGFEDTAHPANGFRTRRAELPATVDWVD